MKDLLNKEILTQAIDKFNEQVKPNILTIKNIELKMPNDCIVDAIIELNGEEFICEVKRNITNVNFNSVLDNCLKLKKELEKPIILVAQYIYPELSNKFAENDISVLDSFGNCNIKKVGLCFFIYGKKNTIQKEKTGRAFQEAGLKLILFFLKNKENINLPYRTISESTGASLGTIKIVIESLIQENFVLVTEKRRFLKNRDKLIQKWVDGYNITIKPKKLITRLSFITKEMRKEWRNMKLPQGMLWSGECAANLLNGYLTPGSFEIYTSVPVNMLFRTGFVKPDANGEIAIYEVFWKDETENIIPNLIIYADLMGSGNSRCIEAAQLIMKNDEN